MDNNQQWHPVILEHDDATIFIRPEVGGTLAENARTQIYDGQKS